jgi:carboxymethylenebutenolidase
MIWAAAAFPERFRCIASIHCASMATDKPDSLHRMVPRIRCESYFACAEIAK